jgi:MIP family channel proteins
MKPYAWNAIVAEALGTFLFFFVGIGAGMVVGYSPVPLGAGLVGVALAHGLVLLVLVSSLGAISGGHFNPAVTFGLWVANRIEGRRATSYVVAQLLGALVAAWLAGYVFGGTAVTVKAGTPALAQGVDVLRGIVIEAALTAVLLTAVFGTVVDPRAPKIGGIAIGLAVGADILMGGPLTGAAMNPARWFGPAVVSGVYDNAIVWTLGPLIGALLVAVVWRFLFLPEADAQTGADV